MSEEKKPYLGAAYGSPEPKQAAADGGRAPPGGNSPAKKSGAADAKHGQAALPDILGKQLRAAYGELLSTPVPDRFNDLIKQLQRREAEAPAKPREEEST
jgi:hypothetical protein